jgi:phage-related holin
MLETINSQFTILNPELTIPQQAGILLILSIIVDFITGILASWIDYKKSKAFSDSSKYIIESAKLRLTAVKFTCYTIGILGAWGIETVFFIKKIPSGYIATENLTLTTVIIGFFCIIEIYSIFFENIKRMGFDVIQTIKNIVSISRKLYKIIKDGPSDN